MDFKNHIKLELPLIIFTIIFAEEGNQKMKGMLKVKIKRHFLMTQVKLLNIVMSEPSFRLFVTKMPAFPLFYTNFDFIFILLKQLESL